MHRAVLHAKSTHQSTEAGQFVLLMNGSAAVGLLSTGCSYRSLTGCQHGRPPLEGMTADVAAVYGVRSCRQTQGRPANQQRRNQPSTAGKGRQQNAPKVMPKAGSNSAPQGLARTSSWKNPANLNLKITIDNTKAQKPVRLLSLSVLPKMATRCLHSLNVVTSLSK